MNTSDKRVGNLVEKAVSHEDFQEEKDIPDLEVSLHDYRKRYEIRIQEESLKQSKEQFKQRMKYADRIFWILCTWLVIVVLVMVFAGFGFCGFILSDQALMTFFISISINVLGLFAIVARWMFPQNGKP